MADNCRLPGVDPEACLVNLIARMPDHPMKRIAGLLPDAWKSARLATPTVITSSAVVARFDQPSLAQLAIRARLSELNA